MSGPASRILGFGNDGSSSGHRACPAIEPVDQRVRRAAFRESRSSSSTVARRGWLRRIPVDASRPPARVEIIGLERGPLGERRGDQVVQLGQTAAAWEVRRHGEGRLAAQRILDEPGQVAACTHVDEHPQAVGVHGLDGLAERDGLGPLRDGELADRLGDAGHAPARGARIDRQRGRTEAHLIEELGDRPDDRPEAGVW